MNFKDESKKRKWHFYIGSKKTATFQQFIQIATKAIPASDTWKSAKGEHYGPYHIDDMNEPVKKALYCVTPTKEVQEYFRKGGYDLLVSHHPFIADKDIPQFITHTPLDCCKGGLNDMWRDILGVVDAEHFDDNLGWYGKLKKPMRFEELKDRVVDFIGGKIEGGIHSNKDMIESVCICSGLGGMVGHKAAKTGADCYIFGESTQPVEEYGFEAAIETGHTKSEWMGIRLYQEIFKDYAITFDLAPSELDVFGAEVYQEPAATPIWTNDYMAQRDEIDPVFQGKTYIPGQSKVYPEFDRDKHIMANDPRFDAIEDDREYDCGITVVLDNGKEIYYDDYNDVTIKDGWLLIKYFDVDHDAFRIHKYPYDRVLRLEEEAEE